jgi:tetratricopeptide (TPR) repeat protein
MDSQDPDSYPYDLGTYTRTITTGSPSAQKWFTRGLLWNYGFNHEEAAHCFERAIKADPDCAMAYWGLALALGPNYNKPWEFFDADELEKTVKRTHDAVQKAQEHAVRASPVEQALVEALKARYPKASERDAQKCESWNRGYAEAMAKVYERFGQDLDVAALYAGSLMDLTPWALWDLRTGEPAEGAETLEVKAVLDKAFSQPGGRDHPGLLHLYIHLMEMSPTPESALPIANRLRQLVPDAGHLQHMPSHLDVLCGDWTNAIEANSFAIVDDDKFLAQEGAENFYSLYRCHDYHFKIYAAMFAGQKAVALETANQLSASIPGDLLRINSPPMADWLEGFLAMRIHALVRFGLWEEIIALRLPEDRELYCTTAAMMLYAKGLAYANTDRLDDAVRCREDFRDSVSKVPESRTLFNNTCVDILAVAAGMLDAEVEFRRGAEEESFEHFKKAIFLSDNLKYDEPWGWMQPPRHAYGALLLEHAENKTKHHSSEEKRKQLIEEALEVYASDLGFRDTLPRACRHPKNIWALHGFLECVEKLGRQDTEEGKLAKKQYEEALKGADIPVAASCACRKRIT